ncbi:hypothetical protein PV08_06990 [Exophiala spinifera]|uniref:Uncharacterized protein n=1 Tax=Exophiala spinifera TaxID=91928 RepID=A0A0D2BSH5_9EURO|nr:uncharacterized protein PV08_06990 [Exophiala spinifera]KIW14209.1 hypothetical protein PV08_06990 [Exophiala spinifera]
MAALLADPSTHHTLVGKRCGLTSHPVNLGMFLQDHENGGEASRSSETQDSRMCMSMSVILEIGEPSTPTPSLATASVVDHDDNVSNQTNYGQEGHYLDGPDSPMTADEDPNVDNHPTHGLASQEGHSHHADGPDVAMTAVDEEAGSSEVLEMAYRPPRQQPGNRVHRPPVRDGEQVQSSWGRCCVCEATGEIMSWPQCQACHHNKCQWCEHSEGRSAPNADDVTVDERLNRLNELSGEMGLELEALADDETLLLLPRQRLLGRLWESVIQLNARLSDLEAHLPKLKSPTRISREEDSPKDKDDDDDNADNHKTESERNERDKGTAAAAAAAAEEGSTDDNSYVVVKTEEC